MIEDPEIRERRYKIELFELDDNWELKDQNAVQQNSREKPNVNKPKKDKVEKNPKALCELVSFSANFALNTIPSATIIPAVGTEIMYGGEKLVYKKLQELAVDSKPVGVYLTVINSSRSSNNKQDKQYWPEKPCCIFKGFVQPPIMEVTAYGSGRQITLLHWLSSLANISLLTTACYIGNPIETSMQSYHFDPARIGNVWNPLLTKTVSITNIWNQGIKQVYTDLLDWGERYKDKYNNLVSEQRKRIRKAIGKITQESELDKVLKNGVSDLDRLVASYIKFNSMSDFVQTDGWSKLISDYCPAFLLALVPQVDKATLIPAPCTINKDKTTEITLDEVFSIQAAPFLAKKIGRMTCVAAESPLNNNTPVGTPHYVGLGTYPPKAVKKEGLNYTIGFPSWITLPTLSRIPQSTDILGFFDEPKASLDAIKDKDKVAKEVNKLQHTVGQRYAQVAYLTQAFNSSFVRVAMPVNMTICPGAMIKLNLNKEGDVSYYGTVANVEINFTSGNTALTTVLTLVNIRNDVSIDDQIDNPQKNVGFYKEQWSGKGVTLYAK